MRQNKEDKLVFKSVVTTNVTEMKYIEEASKIRQYFTQIFKNILGETFVCNNE